MFDRSGSIDMLERLENALIGARRRNRTHRRLASSCARPFHTLVVGGGIAGVAAATVLAERGAAVTLVERNSFLGGRAGSWPDALATGEPFEMERGFHAFFRQYYNLRALLRRVDPDLSSLVPLDDYPLIGSNGRIESFSNLPRRTPFNLIELVRRTPSIRLGDLRKIRAGKAMEILRFDGKRTYDRLDHVTAKELLDGFGFPEEARLMLFEVFAHSFFNPEETMSAAELVAMFHFYFSGNPEGLVFDVMRDPFGQAIWRPFEAYLERAGVDVQLTTTVLGIERIDAGDETDHEARYLATTTDGAIEADALVVALDVPGVRALAAHSPTLFHPDDARAIEALAVTRPFAVLRTWLDRPTADGRAPFAGTAGVGLLDNISLFHLFESTSREWAARTGGSIVELHAYAVDEDLREPEIRSDLMASLHTLYPETRDARVLEERFLLRADCPDFSCSTYARRPTVETRRADLVLAGDYVRTDEPSALMERAAMTGFLAASALLRNVGVQGEVVRSVSPRGLFA